MVEYVGGSPAIWVSDNVKSGVTTANYYEPAINRTYAELARHYVRGVNYFCRCRQLFLPAKGQQRSVTHRLATLG